MTIDRGDIYAGCPHREAIARAANNKTRLERLEVEMDRLEQAVVDIKIAMARQGFVAGAGGGIGIGSVGLVAYVIGKIAGWW